MKLDLCQLYNYTVMYPQTLSFSNILAILESISFLGVGEIGESRQLKMVKMLNELLYLYFSRKEFSLIIGQRG